MRSCKKYKINNKQTNKQKRRHEIILKHGYWTKLTDNMGRGTRNNKYQLIENKEGGGFTHSNIPGMFLSSVRNKDNRPPRCCAPQSHKVC